MSLETLLQRSAWAQGLTPEQRRRVVAEIQVRPVESGAYVCRKGDPSHAWFGVIEGLVKIATASASGKSVTFTGVPAGAWFGEGSVLKRENRKYDVMALRDSVVAHMPIATFDWLLDTSIPFNRFLTLQLNERLGQFIAAVEHERLLDTDARVARSLSSMFNPNLYPSDDNTVQISQEELSYLAGVSRQRVNLALKVLEQAGLVKVDYGVLTILDLEGLREFGM
ncbi:MULTISPECIES: Crp/Fnr family transcriptional regulator [Pandoraea]|jgi:CRP-like cAMP-binding protein|uniref:Crp/Fnr family transcriptional regulator n=2 Tax=Pandoraea TaxID=93217 RepID=A0A378YH34_9BURK|nr:MULTISPECIES: Crp/Fnr family transcriptional regulator [Pandoraea]AHB05443.1 Crp/Fnr family transcriptional regulator [Pandoraea pnomenusa 3kgm]AHB74189.1 Crp/Fnr family transcriptional regulator [Pandoraea pnomenusa]AHN73241.1 Crp/Fnr family transcriptional regulator [Pandoraea pnomenusa]AIU25996.1 Crp/Fnr family transcriptional regulator [Pandoraea pnomenusa]ANC43217.1 Crp/Fnr family transcriptional regulator [Pandoraea pnomenusa]